MCEMYGLAAGVPRLSNVSRPHVCTSRVSRWHDRMLRTLLRSHIGGALGWLTTFQLTAVVALYRLMLILTQRWLFTRGSVRAGDTLTNQLEDEWVVSRIRGSAHKAPRHPQLKVRMR